MAAKELVTVRTHARGHSQVMSIEIEKPRHTMPLAFTNMSNSLDEALEGVERKVIGDCGHLLFTEGKGEAALGKEIAIEIVNRLKTNPGGIMILHSVACDIPPMNVGMGVKCARVFPKEYGVGEAVKKEAVKSIAEIEPHFKLYKRTR